MTAQELAKVAEEVRKDRQHDYAPDTDTQHDAHGHAKDHNFYDHTEDVFPY